MDDRIGRQAVLCVWWVLVGLFAVRAVVALSHTSHLDYGEGPLLDQVLRLSRFENLYRPTLDQPPFTIANYPPLYQLAEVPFALLFGPAYWYARAISLVSATASALLVGLTVKRVTGQSSAGTIAALTLLASPTIYQWAPFGRVDSLALAFSWVALYTAATDVKARQVLLVVLALVCAIFTKQTYLLAAPAAAAMFYAQRGQTRQALVLVSLLAGVCGGIFIALNWATHGGFYFHLVTANVNAFHVRDSFRHFAEAALAVPAFVIAAVLMLKHSAGHRLSPLAPFGLYLVLSLVQGMASGKIGAEVNYFYEFAAACSVAIGLVFSGAILDAKRVVFHRKVLLVQGILLTTLYVAVGPSVRFVVNQASAELRRLIRDTEGPVLCDLSCTGLVPLEGRPLYFQPFEINMLARAGKWSDRRAVADIAGQHFRLIIQDSPPKPLGLTIGMRRALSQKYQQVLQLKLQPDGSDSVRVYRPLVGN